MNSQNIVAANMRSALDLVVVSFSIYSSVRLCGKMFTLDAINNSQLYANESRTHSQRQRRRRRRQRRFIQCVYKCFGSVQIDGADASAASLFAQYVVYFLSCFLTCDTIHTHAYAM